MNKAIVICYTGRQIRETEKAAIENIISEACDATQDLIITTRFDENDIAKTLLKESAESAKISFKEDTTENRIIEEDRTKAIQLIKSKYSGVFSHIALSRDIAMAKYHQRVNSIDDDELNLLNAIDVIVDIPQKRLNTLLSKTVRETIFAMKDM